MIPSRRRKFLRVEFGGTSSVSGLNKVRLSKMTCKQEPSQQNYRVSNVTVLVRHEAQLLR